MANSDTASDGSSHQLTCAACRVIDRADGVEDGQLWNPEHYATPSERDLFSLMRRVQDHTADSISAVAGSMRFVYIHLIWFGMWIAINVGLAGVGHEFDKFPFGLLTMIVSLEAIFLSTFVMISQNRNQRDLTSEASSTSRTTSGGRSGRCTSARHWDSTSTTSKMSYAAPSRAHKTPCAIHPRPKPAPSGPTRRRSRVKYVPRRNLGTRGTQYENQGRGDQ